MLRNVHRWLGAYARRQRPTLPAGDGPIHVLVCVTDHFEPAAAGADANRQRERVATWTRRLPKLSDAHRDADGQPFQYTFFYPAEQYTPEYLDWLADLRRRGIADVEVHLHHDHDTAPHLRDTLTSFVGTLHERHGLLRRNRATGRIEYAFIHGNWTLANCGPNGAWCGVDRELVVLRETGCYADFTMPSAPDSTQARKINSIYYVSDTATGPGALDAGVDVRAGAAPGDGLMLIQGPLALNWRHRKFGVLPRIENAELSANNPPSPGRADIWIAEHVHVQGRPEWLFVKLHAHGAVERNAEALLGPAMDRTLDYMGRTYNDGVRYCLHYVTAREMYSIAKAAEAGCTGNPGDLRNWVETTPGAGGPVPGAGSSRKPLKKG